MLRSALLLLLASLHIRQVALSGCDVTMTTSSGVITSPNYPNNYPLRTVCNYTIRTEPGKTIRLNFQDFNLESSSNCVYDYLQIYDGDNTNSGKLGDFCGSQSGEIRSSQNSLFLRFRSDDSNTYRGFLANYSTIWQITPSVRNISVTSVSSSSVRVHWRSPHRSIEVHNYNVTVKPIARQHSPSPGCPALPPLHSAITVTVNGSSTETDINLPADLEIQVTVTAASPEVLILPSETITGCTLPEASDPVRDFNVDLKTTADSVVFTWKAPCDPGGVLGYFLVVLEGSEKHQNAQNHILNQTASQPLRSSYSASIFISNLTAECMYTVTVTPVGFQGLYGTNHSTSFYVPARVPSQPQNVSATALSISAVRVQWEPPSQYHGTLTNYTVTLQPIAKPDSLEEPQHAFFVTVKASTLTTDINHLLADTEFQTTVTAATSAGQGPPSATFPVHTPSEAEVPTQPQIVSATALSISAVRVQWKPPSQNHGTLTFYTVTLQPLVRRLSPPLFLPKRVVTVTSATLQTDVNDLVAGSDYQVIVTAATSAGQGPPSAPSLVHTPSEWNIPLPPQNVSAAALSSSQVLVQWEPPVESTGTITHYTVTLLPVAHLYTPLSRLHTAVVTVSGSALEANIYHLLEDTEFRVTVTAASAAGQGSPSESTMVHTLPETNGKLLLVLEVLAGFAAAGLVIMFVKWIVTYKRNNTNTSTNQRERQKELALTDLLQCD